MSLPIPSLSAGSSAAAGPSSSGGISGGTSFNIGGINFGYQPQSATSTGGSVPPSTYGQAGVSALDGIGASVTNLPSWALPAAAVAILAVIIILKKRR